MCLFKRCDDGKIEEHVALFCDIRFRYFFVIIILNETYLKRRFVFLKRPRQPTGKTKLLLIVKF